MFSFSMSRVNMKGSRYTEDLLPNLKMTVSDTNTFIFYLFLLTKQHSALIIKCHLKWRLVSQCSELLLLKK